MQIKELLKQIKGVFKPPKRSYYLGKLHYGTPYMYPINFSSTILHIRKLKCTTYEEYVSYIETYPHLKDTPKAKFTNLPMVRRSKDWIVKVFDNYYWIEIGYPIMFKQVELGWKYKYEDIRFEWVPSFQIYFFKWQFCIFWKAPDGNDDLYYSMILWWIHNKKNMEKTKETWNWINFKTKKSTWNDNYLDWWYRDIDLGI